MHFARSCAYPLHFIVKLVVVVVRLVEIRARVLFIRPHVVPFTRTLQEHACLQSPNLRMSLTRVYTLHLTLSVLLCLIHGLIFR